MSTRVARSIVTPEFAELLPESLAIPLQELFVAANGGVEGEDRIYQLEQGLASGTKLAIFSAGLNASGQTSLNFISDAGDIAGLDAGDGLTIDSANGELDADVLSVFGRTGAVTAQSGDYDANQVDYDNATSGLAATDVQAALDEIESSVSSVSGAILDSDFSTNGFMVRTASGAYANRTLQAGTGLSVSDGDGVSANPSYSLDNTAVSAGTYGDATNVAQITVDAQGRITSASDVAIAVNDETIDTVSLAVNDVAGNDNYAVTWTVGGGVTDGDHDMQVVVFNEGSYVDVATVTDPASTLTVSIVDTGGGTGMASNHHALVNLLNSAGQTIYTLAAYALSTVADIMLLESADSALLESGDFILLE